MNEILLDVVNSRGMVVRSIEPCEDTKFGKADTIVIEGATHRITFISNVLYGVNYFKITKVEDLYKDRVYTAQRYFYKFIGLIGGINGETYVKLFNNQSN